MNRGFQLGRWIDRAANWVVQKLAGGVRVWIASNRERTASRYHDYVEGIVAECAYKRKQWREQGLSETTILLLLVPEAVDALGGIFQLTIDRYSDAVRLFLHANDEFLKLLEAANSSPSSSFLHLKQLLQCLHYLTGNVKRPVPKVRICLSPTAQVLDWDGQAEQIFGWPPQDVLGREAVNLFGLPIESSCEYTMPFHLQDACQFPYDFSLTVNQNQTIEGLDLSMFWVNVPVLDQTGTLTELMSVGMQTHEPELTKRFVKVWQIWRQSRHTPWLRWMYLHKSNPK